MTGKALLERIIHSGMIALILVGVCAQNKHTHKSRCDSVLEAVLHVLTPKLDFRRACTSCNVTILLAHIARTMLKQYIAHPYCTTAKVCGLCTVG